MALTRRQFISRAGLVTAGSMFVPNWLRSPLSRQALAQSMGDRFFVILFLDGGNDGLNTVVPIADGSSGGLRSAYNVARTLGNLQIPDTLLAATQIDNDPQTSTPLALHPLLGGVKDLYDQGKVAVIQGAGYPEPHLSHETARRKWITGTPVGPMPPEGWVGQYLATTFGPLDIPAITSDRTIAGELFQTATSVLGIKSLPEFGFPRDLYDVGDNDATDAAFEALHELARQSPLPVMARLGNVAAATFASSKVFPAINAQYAADRSMWDEAYNADPTTTSLSFRDIAACIYGNSLMETQARFFQLSLKGFDTHTAQGAINPNENHPALLREIGDAIQLFFYDLDDMGLADRCTLLVWSEFGRRVAENEGLGTDHGTQAPVFAIGGSVNGGVYGNHPDIHAAALDETGNTVYSQATANPSRSTDLRDIYGTILKHWLNVADPATLLPLDAADKDPDKFWRTADFDLPFLS